MTTNPAQRPRVGVYRRLVERADGSVTLEGTGGREEILQKPLLDDEVVSLVEAADRAWALLSSYEALDGKVREQEHRETVTELAAALKAIDDRVPVPSEDGR